MSRGWVSPSPTRLSSGLAESAHQACGNSRRREFSQVIHRISLAPAQIPPGSLLVLHFLTVKALRIALPAGILVALAAIGLYAMRDRPAPAVDFFDPLTGPSSPQLTIPFDSFALTPNGLLRARAVTARGFGNDRPSARTVSADYLSRDFVFEIDVMVPMDTHDLAYVGFGRGDANPSFNHEPAGAFLFRIHSMPGQNRVDVAASRPSGSPRQTEAGPDVYARIEELGRYIAGSKTTFRIERAGNNVTLSMPATPDTSRTFELTEFPGLFREDEAYLFFGNSAEGTIFSNVRVRPRG
jgi:hypothetical protein